MKLDLIGQVACHDDQISKEGVCLVLRELPWHMSDCCRLVCLTIVSCLPRHGSRYVDTAVLARLPFKAPPSLLSSRGTVASAAVYQRPRPCCRPKKLAPPEAAEISRPGLPAHAPPLASHCPFRSRLRKRASRAACTVILEIGSMKPVPITTLQFINAGLKPITALPPTKSGMMASLDRSVSAPAHLFLSSYIHQSCRDPTHSHQPLPLQPSYPASIRQFCSSPIFPRPSCIARYDLHCQPLRPVFSYKG